LEVLAPEVDLDRNLPPGDLFLDIPEGPPTSGGAPLQVGGDVLAPRKISTPQPAYTEEARTARLQGVVVIQAVIDREGRVSRAKLLKGLPLGLGESALATVKTWLFEPATKNGEPVPVYYNVTVSFSLQ
jgi:protein TonB